MLFQTRQQGFSLIEISLVVVIMAIIGGSILALLSTQQSSARTSATHTKQDAVKQALINFVGQNRRLPCPAVATLAAGTPNYGREATNPGTCTSATIIGATSNRNARGIVPWVALGLSDEATLDGYNRRFTYQVLLSETNLNAATLSGLRGNITLHSATPTAGGNQTNAGRLATAVIVSHGNNGFGAYLPQTGVLMALPTGADELENTDNDVAFMQKDFSGSTTNPYDDIVLALSPADLLNPLQQDKTMRSFGQEQDETAKALENTKVALLGYAMRYRSLPYADTDDDGLPDTNEMTGDIPWQTLGIARQDAWGQVLRYSVAPPSSTSNVLIGAGAKRFTTTVALNLSAGTAVHIQSRELPANYMAGTVTSNPGLTLNVNITEISGSGRFRDWDIPPLQGNITVCTAQTPGVACSGTTLTTSAPFVIYSRGRNGATCTRAAPANPNPPVAPNCRGTNERNNYNNTSPYVQTTISIPTLDAPVVTPPNGYDDMLIYGSTAELTAKVPN